ncbi:MAG TPA: type II toxin-antitoxin system VapC family toxin [Xanthomonadaceae bacterium]|nr:type II toxin-antitoxin system VapC family toxin [Xanthomonadaceae bacterium]
MFLLDTNVISEQRKLADGKADPNVARWTQGTPAEACFISVVTVMELEIGILRVERRDSAQGRRIRRWLDEIILPTFDHRILPIDTSVAKHSAALHVPDPRPWNDAMIVATALVHGMAVVTRNEADFANCGVALINPWRQP